MGDMPPHPLAPLPPSLMGRPFPVRQAIAEGVPLRRTLHASLDRPHHGARAPWPPRTLGQATTALAVALPTPWAWSHDTAAEMLGLPIPTPWEPGRPLHVTRPSTTTRVRRPGVRGHIGLESRATITVAGMPVVHPVPTWCDLAGVLPLIDAVILGDAIAGRGASTTDQLLGDTPLARLTQEARTRAGMRGARRLRAAIALVRDGSRSPMETRARLCFIGAGLPEPELNGEIHEDGQWIATADFVWRAQRLIVEYQGDHHRTDRGPGSYTQLTLPHSGLG